MPTLSLVQGPDEVCEYSLSAGEDGEAGMSGAIMKWFPLGVGKWSLKGERQSDQLGAFGDDDPRRPRSSSLSSPPLIDSSSSSIIVLSERRRRGACTGDGASYVAAGKKSSEAILT